MFIKSNVIISEDIYCLENDFFVIIRIFFVLLVKLKEKYWKPFLLACAQASTGRWEASMWRELVLPKWRSRTGRRKLARLGKAQIAVSQINAF